MNAQQGDASERKTHSASEEEEIKESKRLYYKYFTQFRRSKYFWTPHGIFLVTLWLSDFDGIGAQCAFS